MHSLKILFIARLPRHVMRGATGTDNSMILQGESPA